MCKYVLYCLHNENQVKIHFSEYNSVVKWHIILAFSIKFCDWQNLIYMKAIKTQWWLHQKTKIKIVKSTSFVPPKIYIPKASQNRANQLCLLNKKEKWVFYIWDVAQNTFLSSTLNKKWFNGCSFMNVRVEVFNDLYKKNAFNRSFVKDD